MTNSRIFRKRLSTLGSSLALLSSLLLCSTTEARAQLLQGTINGTVTDPSHAPIAGATVLGKNDATNFVREGTTNEAGFYTLPDLPPGSYSVSIKAASFQAYAQTGVQVAVQTVTQSGRGPGDRRGESAGYRRRSTQQFANRPRRRTFRAGHADAG